MKLYQFAYVFILCCGYGLNAQSNVASPSILVEKKLLHDPTPFLLPANHPLKSTLDSIFTTADVIDTDKSFKKAGFRTLRDKKSSGIRIATHPRLPGYLVKLYLNSQSFHREDLTKQNWLIQRCRGATQIRELINKKHIRYFTVPDKWLYELPKKPWQRKKRTFIIVETYMNLVSQEKTKEAWKKKVTKRHLRELLLFMQIGGTSGALDLNTPYTKEGKFAFIDTEYPDRIFPKAKLKKIGRHFSSKMRKYWEYLIDEKL